MGNTPSQVNGAPNPVLLADPQGQPVPIVAPQGPPGTYLYQPAPAGAPLTWTADGIFDGLPWIDVTHPAFGAVGDGATDDTAAINAALAALPATGAIVFFPPAGANAAHTGVYNHTQDITPTKLVVLTSQGSAGINNVGTHRMATLNYTGAGANPQLSLTGAAITGSQVRGLALNNSGSATVAVDIDNGATVILTNVVCDTPTVAYTTAGARVGNTANVVDTTMRDCFFRAAAPIILQLTRVSANFIADHSRFMQGTVNNVTTGSATTAVRNARFVNNCSFEIAANLDAILVAGQTSLLVVDGAYFEIGGTGSVCNVPNTCPLAQQIMIVNSWITANVTASASWCMVCGFASARLGFCGNYVIGLANPAELVHVTAVAHVEIFDNFMSGTGITATTTTTKVDHGRNFLTNTGTTAASSSSAPIGAAAGLATTAITSGALSTFNFASGTARQINTTRDNFVVAAITYNPTALAAATLLVELSPDNVTFTTLLTISIPATDVAGKTLPLTLYVPAAWWVRLTGTNASIVAGSVRY